MSQVLIVIFIFVFAYSGYALKCFDEDGGPVDWVFVYKLPRSEKSKNPLIKEGVAYVYITADTPFFTLSKYGVDNDRSIVGRHAGAYLKNMDVLTNVAYNDVSPDGSENKTVGHSRGIVIANSDGGIWGIDTIGRFPTPEKKYTFPEYGREKAEFLTCISMSLENLDKIGDALTYRQAQIIHAGMTPDMEARLPKLASFIKGERSAKEPWFDIQAMASSAGTIIASFSKSREFGGDLRGDLYNDLIAPKLRIGLLVRSANSIMEGGLPSACRAPKVENIQSLSIKAAGITISNDEDDAKWAITRDFDNGGWFCIGDLDRTVSDKRRGGGATCIFDRKLVERFRELIKSVEKCP